MAGTNENVRAGEKRELEKGLIDVARLRDEVRVQMHLAKAEAKDAYDRLEVRWQKLMGKAGAVKEVSVETAGDLKAATGLVIEELKEGYERLKRELAG